MKLELTIVRKKDGHVIIHTVDSDKKTIESDYDYYIKSFNPKDYEIKLEKI